MSPRPPGQALQSGAVETDSIELDLERGVTVPGEEDPATLAIDPGEMDTEMHAAALPDADPATLQRPADVAAIFAAIVSGEARTGARIEAPSWEVSA